MSTVTIPKKEYEELLEKKQRYELIRHAVEEDIFSPPPIKDAKEILKSFAATGKYNKKFLTSLAKGLRRSLYFRK